MLATEIARTHKQTGVIHLSGALAGLLARATGCQAVMQAGRQLRLVRDQFGWFYSPRPQISYRIRRPVHRGCSWYQNTPLPARMYPSPETFPLVSMDYNTSSIVYTLPAETCVLLIFDGGRRSTALHSYDAPPPTREQTNVCAF